MKSQAQLIEKLSASFEPLRGISLIKGQYGELHDKLNQLESKTLKSIIEKDIPHVTETAANILLFRNEISEEQYFAVNLV